MSEVTSNRGRHNRFGWTVVMTIAATSAVSGHAYAAKNWDGDNPSGNFSFNNNWFGDTQPNWTFADGNLNFTFSNNSSQTSLFFDYGGWRDTSDIFWNSTYGKSMVLSSDGNGLNFTQRIENQSSFAQTVNMPTSGGKNGVTVIELNPVAGNLTISGTIFNDNSVDYFVYGSNTATLTTLTLNTPLGPNATQANVDFTVAGSRNTTVNVAASQVWAGTTTVNSGSFVTSSGVTLASPTIVVAGGTVTTTSANTFADAATITVNSGKLSVGGSDTVASVAGSGGTVDLAAGATLTTGGAGSTSYAGSITGSGNLTKVGSGTFTLSSANTFTGTARVTAGQLSLSAANLLADTVSVVTDGGVISFGGSDTIGSLAGTGGTVAIGSNTLTVSQSGNTTFAGALTGSGTFAKSGAGALTVSGNASAYAGATLVQAGELAVQNSLGGSVNVSLNAILSGTGTIGGNVSVSGSHAPGGATAVGVQQINGNLSYQAGSILNWNLVANTTGGTGNFDQVVIPTGDLNFAGATSLQMAFNSAGSAVDWSNSFWNVNRTWLLQDLSSGVTSNVSNFSIAVQNWLDGQGDTLSSARPDATFNIGVTGQDVVINYVAVPEPTTTVAVIGGLAALAGYASRRRSSR